MQRSHKTPGGMRRLLVANRGEIACRIMRTASAMGLSTVAVYSDADARALHVEMADEALALRGVAPGETYLDIDKLVAAAQRSGADAVHPGYGFLAENAAFAQACIDAGLTWVGPQPDVIAAMGDKLRAKALMADAGVPVLDNYEPGAVPPDAFPVLVKAAAGGGGKGMRLVHSPTELDEAVAAAQRESASAFGDDRVFIERFLDHPRHIEVQILGDSYGNVVHLGERECSVQRRHQKIIEESPSPFVDDALRAQLCAAAVSGAGALGYTSAGTFEFVVSGERDAAFLEVNTRLQVEHPVTELAWGLRDGSALDLVRLQLLVAAGEPLPFGQDDVVQRQHAVEARVYAEDPAAGFLPATGTLVRFQIAAGIRTDSGVRTGDVVGSAYDPMLAKVISAAPGREEAVALLASALGASRINGVTTNRDFLVTALRHERFVAGTYDTSFVAEHMAGGAQPPGGESVPIAAIAAALHAAMQRRQDRTVLQTIPLGWRNNSSQPQRVVYSFHDQEVTVTYQRNRDGSFRVDSAGRVHEVTVFDANAEHIDLELDGRRLRAAIDIAGADVYVDSTLGHVRLTEVPRFGDPSAATAAGGLTAPMPGAVVSVAVAAGAEVAQGDLLVVLEAMKMEHRVVAPRAGTVTAVNVASGDSVAAGDVLVIVSE